MKKVILGIMVIAGFVFAMFVCGKIANTYSVNGVVVKSDGEEVFVLDETGEVFSYFGDEEEGKEVKIIFDNNGTDDTRNDDVIIDVK